SLRTLPHTVQEKDAPESSKTEPDAKGKESAPKSPPAVSRPSERQVRGRIPAPPAEDPFMVAALNQARIGLKEGGIPIGSALVRRGELLAVGHNKRVQDGDPMTHAETDCLRRVGRIGSYRGCTLYSTLMPCYFCAGAAVQFGIRRVIV